jgi:predicted metalloprotease
VRFRRQAELDPGQVQDRRGLRPLPLTIGGGGLAALLFLIVSLLSGGGDPSVGGLPLGEGGQDLAAECRTGADANQRQDCRIVGVVNSVQDLWQERLDPYRKAPTVFFEGLTNSACGLATSEVGPFYCPLDETVYIDLGFYSSLTERFGARGGPFAEAYVIAHEYGHHVQHLLGILELSREGGTGPESPAVRIELMADCLAGVWASGAVATGFIEELTTGDIQDGLDAAAAVGDDRIQTALQGRVEPESWTHGSAEQRQSWFLIGYESGRLEDCDTFQ